MKSYLELESKMLGKIQNLLDRSFWARFTVFIGSLILIIWFMVWLTKILYPEWFESLSRIL